MRATTGSLVAALRQLAKDIQSPDGGANLVCAQAAGRITEVCDLLARQTRWAAMLARQLRMEGWVDADFETLRDGLHLDNWGQD